MRVVINGAGIAGPALAYWLTRAGHEVLLVEHAPRPRTGGYVIDFWGLGYDLAERMGVLPEVLEAGYQVREIRLVDDRGRRSGGFPADVFRRMLDGRFTSVRRSDIAAAILRVVEGRVETRFGDSVAAIEQTPGGVRVELERSAPCSADLVIGADGLHSRVRELAFGPAAGFEVSLGYHVAAFEIAGYRPRDELVYVSHAAPGRQVARFAMRGDRTLVLFVCRDEYLPPRVPDDTAGRHAALRHAFAGVRWECPALLDAMPAASDFYFDRVAQVRMDRWAAGRVALVGDAAACVSLLAGEGTGLALVEAYVLAGELSRSPGDHAAAFARYHAVLAPFLRRKQAAAAKFASTFAPATRWGIRVRDLLSRVLGIPFVADRLIGRDLRDDVVLPDYG